MHNHFPIDMNDDICEAIRCQEKRSMPSPYCAHHLELWKEGGVDAVNSVFNRSIKKLQNELANIVVTTGDISSEYEIIGPVYFSLNNASIPPFSQFDKLAKFYSERIQTLMQVDQVNTPRMDWGILYGELSFDMGSKFDQAFFIAVEELKMRTHRIGGDAIIHLRQDIDLDTNGFQRFYLQMYGTAVKLKDK